MWKGGEEGVAMSEWRQMLRHECSEEIWSHINITSTKLESCVEASCESYKKNESDWQWGEQ